MNTRNVVIAVIFLLLGSFATMELKAQDAIKALMKKCESMENVTIDVIRNRNSVTGRRPKNANNVIIRISYKSSSNQSLDQEIIAAFQKDRDRADREMINKSDGKIIRMNFIFGNSNFSYNYDAENDMINITARFNE